MVKLAARFALGTSNSVPGICLHPKNVHFINDIGELFYVVLHFSPTSSFHSLSRLCWGAQETSNWAHHDWWLWLSQCSLFQGFAQPVWVECPAYSCSSSNQWCQGKYFSLFFFIIKSSLFIGSTHPSSASQHNLIRPMPTNLDPEVTAQDSISTWDIWPCVVYCWCVARVTHVNSILFCWNHYQYGWKWSSSTDIFLPPQDNLEGASRCFDAASRYVSSI